MHYQYEFVRIPLKSKFLTTRPATDYQAEVHARATDGWRLVQVFSPPAAGYGSAGYFELIFERPVEEN